MSLDVLIAAAPFLSVARPSLGASAIAAAAQERGYTASVDYLNLHYAARMGLDVFEYLCDRSPAHFLVGEWVFAHCLDLPVRPDAARDYAARIADALGPERFDAVQAARADAPRAVAEMAERLLVQDARVFGFTSTFQQNCASLALMKAIKDARPEACVVIGGANCDGPMGAALARNFPFIDAVFTGESDLTFPAFLDELTAGTAAPARRLRQGQPVTDLDTLPVPGFADYTTQLEVAPFRDRVCEGILFESARGCWWGAKTHCKFCGLNGQGMAFRAKSPARVRSEIATITQAHGTTRFAAADNIMDMRHIPGVFDVLASEDHDLTFFYEVKSNLKPDHLARIRAGGVSWIQPGIESLDDDILREMGKGVTGLQNIRLLRSCMELGIHPVWNLLCGFPNESRDAYARMAAAMPALEHLAPPSGHSPIRLDRFSPYFEKAADMGYRNLRPASAYATVYGLPDADLAELAYFFEGDADGLPEPGYLDPFIAAIADWRAAHAPGQTLPDLALIDVGGVRLVKDTRRCATQAISILPDAEHAVLTALREPARPDVVLDALPDLSAAQAQAAYAGLRARHLILEDLQGRAVSLVCEPAALARAAPSGFPGGYIRPAPAPASAVPSPAEQTPAS